MSPNQTVTGSFIAIMINDENLKTGEIWKKSPQLI